MRATKAATPPMIAANRSARPSSSLMTPLCTGY
jgi:hypothetical protein